MVGLYDDAFRVHVIDNAVTLSDNNRTRIASRDLFHTRPDIRRLGTKKRHRLTLHVRSHKGTVGVIVLKERDQRRGHRNKLFWRNVHVLNVRTVSGDKLTFLTSGVSFANDVAFFVQFDIRLADDPLIFFPSGQIEWERLEFCFLSALFRDFFIGLNDIFQGSVFTRLEFSVAAVADNHIFDNAAILDLSVWRFDKAEFVYSCKTRQA